MRESIDFQRLAVEGQDLAYQRGGDHLSPGTVIWQLTLNAADALARWRPRVSDGRSAPGGYWPDMTHDEKERRSVEWQRWLEGVQVEATVYVPPTPREIERIEIMRMLWDPRRFGHMIRGDPVMAVKAIWLSASGVSLHRIRAITGVDKAALYSRRRRFCDALGEQIVEYMMRPLERSAKSA